LLIVLNKVQFTPKASVVTYNRPPALIEIIILIIVVHTSYGDLSLNPKPFLLFPQRSAIILYLCAINQAYIKQE